MLGRRGGLGCLDLVKGGQACGSLQRAQDCEAAYPGAYGRPIGPRSGKGQSDIWPSRARRSESAKKALIPNSSRGGRQTADYGLGVLGQHFQRRALTDGRYPRKRGAGRDLVTGTVEQAHTLGLQAGKRHKPSGTVE